MDNTLTQLSLTHPFAINWRTIAIPRSDVFFIADACVPTDACIFRDFTFVVSAGLLAVTSVLANVAKVQVAGLIAIAGNRRDFASFVQIARRAAIAGILSDICTIVVACTRSIAWIPSNFSPIDSTCTKTIAGVFAGSPSVAETRILSKT